MSEPDGPSPQSEPTSGGAFKQFLDRIPLKLRIATYALAFLLVVPGLLPWLAYRIDIHFPQLHVDIGPIRYIGVVWFFVCMFVYLRSSYLLTSRGKGGYIEFDDKWYEIDDDATPDGSDVAKEYERLVKKA